MPTPQPNEPIQIPTPDIIRPPTPAEAPEPDVPASLPEPGPDIVYPTPPREIPPARPQEVPSAERRASTLSANASVWSETVGISASSACTLRACARRSANRVTASLVCPAH